MRRLASDFAVRYRLFGRASEGISNERVRRIGRLWIGLARRARRIDCWVKHMEEPLRLCLFDEVAPRHVAFARSFEDFEGVEVIATHSEWKQLHECVMRRDADIFAVNLDGPTALEIVQKISRQAPQCGIIGISSVSDASFIIKAMRAGCTQFVCAPVDHDDLHNAIQRVRPAKVKSGPPSRRICVVGSSGGSGATTLACNLAMEMGHLVDRRVALVDLNLEYGDVSCSFDCSPKYSIADLCGEGIELDHDTLAAVLHELPCNVSLIARPEHVEEAREVTPDGVDLMFRMLAEQFPFVVVDLPRAYNFINTVAVGRADHILIVTQLGVPFVRNAGRIYQTLLNLGAEPDQIHIVLNRFNADFGRISVKDVQEHFRRPIFAVIPNDYQFVSASLDLGHPIGADAPTSKCRAAIQELARKLAPEFTAAAGPDAAGRGIFNKILGRRPKTAKH